MKIICFGSSNIDYTYRVDHIVREGETISASSRNLFPGGKGLNQSIALARAGSNVFHAGKIGKDDGGFLQDFLEENDVDLSYLSYWDGPTGHAIIQVDEKGQNSIFLFQGANGAVTKADVDHVLETAAVGDWLILQNETNLIDYMIESGYAHGMNIVFNTAPFTQEILFYPLDKVTYLVMNETEASEVAGIKENCSSDEILDKLEAIFPETAVLLTLGAKGSVFMSKGSRIKQEAFKVNPVDTTGAGDTFTGFFIHCISHKYSIPDALLIATTASAIMISRCGAAPSIPTMEEVLNYNKAYYAM